MADRKTVISHLQIIHTWASFALERDLQFFTPKHLEDITQWVNDALELLKEQEQAMKEKDGTISNLIAQIKEISQCYERVVRCKYCKHSEEWYGDKRRCFLWHESGIDVFEDGFCNYGKRK